MVTGPVTKNMREALERTYDATPDPKWVVAVGDCARDGGIFSGSYAVVGGVSAVVPVDLHIRGCPPRPAFGAGAVLRIISVSICVIWRFSTFKRRAIAVGKPSGPRASSRTVPMSATCPASSLSRSDA